MKTLVFRYLVLAVTAGLAACDRASAPVVEARATPSPTPADTTAERMRAKNAEAARATGDYLKERGEQLKTKLQKAGDQLGIDKEVWRKQLEEKKRQYQPQIDELKRKAPLLANRRSPSTTNRLPSWKRNGKKPMKSSRS